ncbi:MAG: right-handed parallel beta-helix repeat-containing protein [Planctomycetota bacterium]|jgi:hypothetical protein
MCKKAIFLVFIVWVPALLSVNAAFGTSSKKASNPVPPDGATSVSTNVTLTWTRGLGAKLHTVYFGDNFDDVYDAAGGAPQGMPAFTPGPLELDITYYWRVDEFDTAQTHKGDVWSFTTGTEIPPPENVYYVDANAPGNNDGSSWANAYLCLQDAMADANDSAKPVEIRVAQGTYTPDCGQGYVRGDKEAKFFLTSGVTLKGGFAGAGADNPDAWDHKAYKTVLSGDLSGNDERLLDNFAENSDHVIWCIEADASAVLDGFTITGGYATGRIGGGLLNFQANPTIKRCVFFDNYASQGGGMANRYSSPTVSDCTFTGSLVRYGGGGMYNTDQSHPIVESCIFHDNWSTVLGGGGMYCGDSDPSVINCLFVDNRAPFGGGMYSASANPTITNCTFSNNRANAWGGGMQNEGGARPTITNCILWGNTPDQITTFGGVLGQDADGVTYCNIQGGHDGEGNIDVDPLFADPSAGDYHLKSQAGRWDPASDSWVIDEVTSPCIDAGNPDHPDGAIFEPDPNGGRINMGAYGGTPEASKSTSASATSASTIESFEQGFEALPWQHLGNTSWRLTSLQAHTGEHSAQAGAIGDGEDSTLEITLDCTDGSVSFFCKISSESNWDWLTFYIDGVQQDRWSGEQDWTEVSYPVTSGRRTFRWTYSKDESSDSGDDTCWIDEIAFPVGGGAGPEPTPDPSPEPPESDPNPNVAGSPVPADGAVVANSRVTLNWSAVPTARSYDVHLIDNRADLEAGLGFLGNQNATRLDVGRPGCPYPNGLVSGEMYFWRVDVVDVHDNVHTGKIWCFKVQY